MCCCLQAAKSHEQPLKSFHKRSEEAVSKWCQSHPDTLSKAMLDHMFVDDARKVIFCFVDTAADHTLKQIWTILSNTPLNTTKELGVHRKEPLQPWDPHVQYNAFKNLAQFSGTELSSRLANYYKFLFVRNPLERLFDAYLDALYLPGLWGTREGRLLNLDLMQALEVTPENQACSNDIKFKDFIRNTLYTPQLSPSLRNVMPYPLICDPCNMKYDYIGMVENLHTDIR